MLDEHKHHFQLILEELITPEPNAGGIICMGYRSLSSFNKWVLKIRGCSCSPDSPQQFQEQAVQTHPRRGLGPEQHEHLRKLQHRAHEQRAKVGHLQREAVVHLSDIHTHTHTKHSKHTQVRDEALTSNSLTQNGVSFPTCTPTDPAPSVLLLASSFKFTIVLFWNTATPLIQE